MTIGHLTAYLDFRDLAAQVALPDGSEVLADNSRYRLCGLKGDACIIAHVDGRWRLTQVEHHQFTPIVAQESTP